MKLASKIGLERPRFGQVVRQLIGLRSDLLEACLQDQRQRGGRLGEILCARGLITREQLLQILRYQANWVAEAMQADLKPHGLPHQAFLSVCLPAFNEACNIQDTLDAAFAILPSFVHRFEVIVIDDGSRDPTGELLSAYAEREPRLRMIPHETNRGYGMAVATGLRAARGDLVAITDADGQFSFLDLPQFLAQADTSDVVIGMRPRTADPLLRRLSAWGWSRLVRMLLGVQFQDLDCSFKLFRREVLETLHLTATGTGINAEIMAQCVWNGLRVREVPVTHFPRYYGPQTAPALRVSWQALRELPGLWKYRTEPVPALPATLDPSSAALAPAVRQP